MGGNFLFIVLVWLWRYRKTSVQFASAESTLCEGRTASDNVAYLLGARVSSF